MLKILREEISALDTSRKAVRSFGLVVGSVLTAIAVLVFWRSEWTPTVTVYVLGGAGLGLILLGLIAPFVLRPVYRAWMALAILLGFVVTRVILTIVFYLVVTPTGIIMRLFGKDPLHDKIDPDADTYWISKTYENESAARLERYY